MIEQSQSRLGNVRIEIGDKYEDSTAIVLKYVKKHSRIHRDELKRFLLKNLDTLFLPHWTDPFNFPHWLMECGFITLNEAKEYTLTAQGDRRLNRIG